MDMEYKLFISIIKEHMKKQRDKWMWEYYNAWKPTTKDGKKHLTFDEFIGINKKSNLTTDDIIKKAEQISKKEVR